MKTISVSVVLLMFALFLLGVTGCATSHPDNSNTIPWDRPDIADSGGMPFSGNSWKH
jgi:hypothetical protein